MLVLALVPKLPFITESRNPDVIDRTQWACQESPGVSKLGFVRLLGHDVCAMDGLEVGAIVISGHRCHRLSSLSVVAGSLALALASEIFEDSDGWPPSPRGFTG